MLTLARSLSTCALLLLPSFPAWSQSIELGRETPIQALVCDTKEKADAIIKTHAEQGLEEATKLAGTTCLSARFLGTPVLVVSTRPLGRLTLKVVQVQIRMADGTTTSWFAPTWYDIKGGLST